MVHLVGNDSVKSLVPYLVAVYEALILGTLCILNEAMQCNSTRPPRARQLVKKKKTIACFLEGLMFSVN